MKKLFLILVAALSISAVSAQEFALGLRAGSGAQAVAQLKFSNDNYLEARFGASWINPVVTVTTTTENSINVNSSRVCADFTLLYNWHIFDMDWTPKAGRWFFDAGAGVNVGGKAHFAYVGLAGMARLGIAFNNAPVSLSVDWTPSFGPRIAYAKEWSEAQFNDLALANFGVTCTFHF